MVNQLPEMKVDTAKRAGSKLSALRDATKEMENCSRVALTL
jgi:hypothetical protein